jgi:hypothetical protein
MTVDLFAGIPVNDYAAALTWYERLLGSPPVFFPNDTEAVWELAEHRFLFIERRPEHAGRGLEPAKRETYSNGVRKTTYRDPDGNEIGLGGAPADPS